jgi:hypothetical protein
MKRSPSSGAMKMNGSIRSSNMLIAAKLAPELGFHE